MPVIINDFDIRTVDTDILVDADDVKIDLDAPKIERMTSAVKQMKGNPFFFKCKKDDGSGYIAVQVSHIDTSVSLDDCTESWLRTI